MCDSVTSIGLSAFGYCSELLTLTIPSSVTFIGDCAFEYCGDLEEVYCYVPDPAQITIGVSSDNKYYGMFRQSYNYGNTLYVPQGAGAAYRADSKWNNPFYNIVEMGDGSDMPGDVDGNGVLTISDITVLINYLLTDDPANVNMANADVNGDGVVNVSDITELINYLLYGGDGEDEQ